MLSTITFRPVRGSPVIHVQFLRASAAALLFLHSEAAYFAGKRNAGYRIPLRLLKAGNYARGGRSACNAS